MLVYTAWPFIGAGTHTNPYRVTFVPLAPGGQARLLRSGLTCFRRELGGAVDPDNDPPLAALAKETLASAVKVADLAGHRLVAAHVPELLVDAWAGLAGYLWAETLEELAGLCATERARLLPILRTARPDLEWDADPDTNAAETIGALNEMSALGAKVRTHYEAVLYPPAATPGWFDGLVTNDVANYAKADLYDTTDPATEVGLADAAWRFLHAGDVAELLPSLL